MSANCFCIRAMESARAATVAPTSWLEAATVADDAVGAFDEEAVGAGVVDEVPEVAAIFCRGVTPVSDGHTHYLLPG